MDSTQRVDERVFIQADKTDDYPRRYRSLLHFKIVSLEIRKKNR
jgi:hypothetical protein